MKYKLQFWFSYNTTDKLYAEIVLLLLNDTVYSLLKFSVIKLPDPCVQNVVVPSVFIIVTVPRFVV